MLIVSDIDPMTAEGFSGSLVDATASYPAETAALLSYVGGLESRHAATTVLQNTLRTYIALKDLGEGKGIGDEIYRATLLQSLGEMAVSGQATGGRVNEQSLAISSLKTYRGTQPPEKWTETAAFLVGSVDLKQHLKNMRRQALAGTRIAASIDGDDQASFSKAFWNYDIPTVDTDSIDAMLDAVDVETVIKESIRQIDRLKMPSSNDAVVFRHVMDTQVYVKVCKAMGFDGVAMALGSAAGVMRLEKLGMHSVVEEARSELEPYGRVETQTVVNGVLKDLFGSYRSSQYSFEDNADHDIIMGESKLERAIGAEKALRVIWRRKSVGSYAMKLFKKPGQKPRDLIGMTIITRDLGQLSDVFSQLQININASKHATFAYNDPEQTGIYIQGDQNYIDTIKKEMADVGLDPDSVTPEDPKQHKKQFRVAKVTVEFDGVPVEIMVQTKPDRRRARVGRRASHDGYKEGGPRLGGLKRIKKRAKSIGAGAIEYTKERARELDGLLDNATESISI